ncbi:MAG: amidohydrolase family protein [Candidatus Latescibacterota bacterium]|nr:amidohydrolase family protein [Candidatus Latescibacterota bacterium]
MTAIIDTHQHLWDLNQFDLPWAAGSDILNRSFLMSDYLDATAEIDVVKTVYMEVDVTPSQAMEEANYVNGLCAAMDNRMAAAVASGQPGTPGATEALRALAELTHIRGIRQVLHVPDATPGHCLQKTFVADVRLLGELDLTFDLCMRPSELGHAVQLVESCPDTQFILDHCGNADPVVVKGDAEPDLSDAFSHTAQQWHDDISRLAALDNVVCKISGIVARVPEQWDASTLAPTVNTCLDAFGPNRVIFGGDWPVCTMGASYREWTETLLQIIASRPQDEQDKLLHSNAAALYCI